MALALAGCAPSPPLVTTLGTPPVPAFAVAGDGVAADEVRRQLAARGWLATDAAAATVHVGFAATPRAVGACAADAADGDCKAWLDAPQAGFAPFAPALRYRLAIDFGDARIVVTKPGGTSEQPLADMVTLALDRLAPR